MIELTREQFDSGLFGKEVYKIHIRPPFPNASALRDAIIKQGPDLVFAFIPFFSPLIETLEDGGFHLISVRCTYKLKTNTAVKVTPLPTSMQLISLKNAIHISNEDIREMALTIGNTSRYFNDKRIPRHHALELYQEWIKNSLSGGYATEAFLILSNTRMIGLITLKVNEGQGVIDLIGVSPSIQRTGLGRHLVDQAVNFFITKGVNEITVVTEGENITASAFYQKRGFILDDIALAYHLHT